MSRKVLVVDDVAENLYLVGAILQEENYAVVTATNGIKGLEKARNEKPDLIIADVMMPEMDGFAMFKELKKDQQTSDIPVVIVTVRKQMLDVFEALGVGGFFAKPFDSGQLLKRVNSLCFSPETIKVSEEKEEKSVVEVKNKKVLLFGETRKAAETMKEYMRDNGHYPAIVPSEQDVVPKTVFFEPDIIFLETGKEARRIANIIEKLRKTSGFEKIPIIVYSFLDKSNIEGGALYKKMTEVEAARRCCIDAGASDSMGNFQENSFAAVLDKYLKV